MYFVTVISKYNKQHFSKMQPLLSNASSYHLHKKCNSDYDNILCDSYGHLMRIRRHLMFLCFACSISKSNTYQLLKPQLDIVLFEIIFPLMCFNDNDEKLWREDPHEYVRKGYGKLPSICFLRNADII